MGYAYDESPFVPLPTTTSGNSRPTEAMKDAEIAKLRAERDEAHEESAARLQRFCVPHWGDKNGGRCPICERDHVTSEWSRDRNAFIAEKDDLHSHLAAAQKERDDARAVAIQSDDTASRFRTKAYRLEEQNIILTAALAAARAALDGERELHDETQRALNLGIEFAFDAADGRPGIETACEIIAKYDERRAAEAKASRGGEGGSVNLQSFNAAVEAAEAFLARAKRVEWTEVKRDDGKRIHYPTNGKANGAVKRASLDLTRALAEMRKP